MFSVSTEVITEYTIVQWQMYKQYHFQNKGYVPLPQAVHPSQQAYPPQSSGCSSLQLASPTQERIPQQPLSEVIGEFFC